MRQHTRLAAIAAATALGMAGSMAAQAQDAVGGYIGLSAGQTDTDVNNLDSGTGYRLYGGYMYTPGYGVEVGYIDGGEFDGRGALAGTSVEANGAYIAGVGSLPVSDRVTLLGKIGAFHYDADTKVGGATVANADGTELMLGLGVDYHVNSNVAIGAEYDMVSDVEDSDVDAIWFNVRFDLDGQ